MYIYIYIYIYVQGILSSLWTVNNVILARYVCYTFFSMCVYVIKFLRTANNAYFCLFYFDFASYKFVVTLVFN